MSMSFRKQGDFTDALNAIHSRSHVKVLESGSAGSVVLPLQEELTHL